MVSGLLHYVAMRCGGWTIPSETHCGQLDQIFIPELPDIEVSPHEREGAMPLRHD